MVRRRRGTWSRDGQVGWTVKGEVRQGIFWTGAKKGFDMGKAACGQGIDNI